MRDSIMRDSSLRSSILSDSVLRHAALSHSPRRLSARKPSLELRWLCLGLTLTGLLMGCAAKPPGSPQVAPAEGQAPADSGNQGGSAEVSPFEGTTDRTDVTSTLTSTVQLKDVRTGQHEGYERVVFELATAGVPGYTLEYAATPATACGSGEPVQLVGAAQLELRLKGTVAHTEDGKSSLSARALKPGYATLKELKLSCDFEGQVTWVLGLESRRPYRVQTLSGPDRLVVDIQR